MKNRYIELERFVASCMILLLHLGISQGSWIFVEFFFLLTGCFTASHLEKKEKFIGDNTWYSLQYTWNKFLKIFPYAGLSITWLWLIRLIAYELKGNEFVRWLLCLPTELMLLSGSGMVPKGLEISEGIYSPRLLNDHLWYICCMLFVLPLVIYLLMGFKKTRAIILTFCPMLLYGLIVMKSGTITGWHDENYAFLFCSMRALAGLLLGGFAYYVSKWWQTHNFTCFAKILLTIVELEGFVGVVVVSHLTSLSYDALFIVMLFLSISLSYAGVTYTTKLKFKCLDFLGAISLPIYCLQMPVMATCHLVIGIYNPWIEFVLTILLSVLVEVLFKLAGRCWKICKPKITSWFVEI